MMKYYKIFRFIIYSIFSQIIIFISNINEDIDPSPENTLDVITVTLNIPWYQNIFSLKTN